MTIKITDAADGDVLRAGPMAVRVLEDGTSTVHRPARRPDLYVGYFRELDAQPSGPLDPAVAGEIMPRYVPPKSWPRMRS
ncbi:MAG TPA: hypothetical protein VHT26_15255 [Trebonia sp.]|jgi:hypothetical protein|nr:hypothetical protein [Trebonia sp.]